jgi:hypothetical protein
VFPFPRHTPSVNQAALARCRALLAKSSREAAAGTDDPIERSRHLQIAFLASRP